MLWAVVRILARRLRATDEALADAMFLDVTGRTAKRLLELADGEDEFRMPLTQEELAGMVGASRERVNKAIALFVKLGWLEISGRSQYRILDRDELEDRARQSSVDAATATSSRRARWSQQRGGVVGAVHGAVGVVHEAVLGAFDRRRSRSRRGRSTRRAAPRCRPAGVHGSFVPKIASVGHISRGDVERLDACGPGPRQPSGVRNIP